MMKKIWYVILAGALCLGLCAVPQPGPATLAEEKPAEYTEQALIKDETIYLTLQADGTVKETTMVNRLEVPAAGLYTDYGTYDSLTNLSGEEIPTQKDGAIIWALDAYPAGFYYQGTMKGGVPPFSLKVSFKLDGKTVTPEEIAGKSGKVELTISLTPNEGCEEYFKNNFMCQVQVPLDLSTAKNIAAPGAMAKVISGKTVTLAYMAMPGSESEYTIAYDSTGFSLDSIMATCSTSDVSGILGTDLGTVKDGVDQLISGQNQIISGTKQLKSGMGTLNQGIGQLSSGASELSSGLGQYVDGINGVITELEPSLDDLKNALEQIPDDPQLMLDEYHKARAMLDSAIASVEELIDEIPEEYRPAELLEQLEGMKEKLPDVELELKDFEELIAGIDRLKPMLDQVGEVKQGGADLKNGMAELSKGLSTLYSKTKGLPGQIQQLINGQTQMKDGIVSATALFDRFGSMGEGEITSFAAPGKVKPRSVQFLMTTDAITAP